MQYYLFLKKYSKRKFWIFRTYCSRLGKYFSSRCKLNFLKKGERKVTFLIKLNSQWTELQVYPKIRYYLRIRHYSCDLYIRRKLKVRPTSRQVAENFPCALFLYLEGRGGLTGGEGGEDGWGGGRGRKVKQFEVCLWNFYHPVSSKRLLSVIRTFISISFLSSCTSGSFTSLSPPLPTRSLYLSTPSSMFHLHIFLWCLLEKIFDRYRCLSSRRVALSG